MLYDGTAATAVHMYTMLIVTCVRAQVHTFIYRSNRNKFRGHLIPSHIKRVVIEWL